MKADTKELLEFFRGLYNDDKEAAEIKAGIREDLKSYAEEIEVEPKALRSAYTLYKKYADGKDTAEECSDYNELSNIVVTFFGD